jgi:hypothetical protein
MSIISKEPVMQTLLFTISGMQQNIYSYGLRATNIENIYNIPAVQDVQDQNGWVMVRCDSKYDPISGGNQQSRALNVIGLNCISCESIH